MTRPFGNVEEKGNPKHVKDGNSDEEACSKVHGK